MIPLFSLLLADDLTQREKRRQNLDNTKPKRQMSSETKKNLIIAGIVVVVGGAIVLGMQQNQAAAAECPGHWHASYTVFVDGERVPFKPNQPNSPHGIPYNPSEPVNDWEDQNNAAAAGTHSHGDDGTYHFHPAISRCTPMAAGFEHMDFEVKNDRLIFGSEHGSHAGELVNNDTHQVRLFSRPIGGEWSEESNPVKALDHQPKNGEAFAIFYGDETQEEIDALLATAKVLDGGTYDPRR